MALLPVLPSKLLPTRARELIERVRALPWPRPVQRVTRRALDRVAARFGTLASLLGLQPAGPADAAPAPRESEAQAPVPAHPGQLTALRVALQAKAWETRMQAARELAGTQDFDCQRALVQALRDPSEEVALSAVHALGQSGGELAQRALVEVLTGTDRYCSVQTRAVAAQALGRLLPEGDDEPLRLATRDIDAEVSIAAIAALIERGGARAVSALLSILENADGFFLPITRIAAARGLEQLGPLDPSTIERVQASEQNDEIRWILQSIRDRRVS